MVAAHQLRSATALVAVATTALSATWISGPVERVHVAVHARGIGAPDVVLTDGLYEPARVRNGRLPDNMAEAERVRPTALTTADFNEDGVADVVAAYSTPGGGLIGFRAGNRDAFVPYRDGKRISPRPPAYGAYIELHDLPTTPDFIAHGDFNADGHLDLVAGSRTRSELTMLAGDGAGGFVSSARISLPAFPKTLKGGDVNRRDGLADLAVSISDSAGHAILVFESIVGAASADPERIPLEGEATDVAFENINDGYPIDLVVAAGNGISIIEGRDRKLAVAASVRPRVAAARVAHIDVGDRVTSITTGKFVGSSEEDVAALTESGDLIVVDGETRALVTTPYRFASAGRHTSVLHTTTTAALVYDDLVVVDPDNRAIHLLHKHHFDAAMAVADRNKLSYGTEIGFLPAPAPPPLIFLTVDRPVALETRRINDDGLEDFIVLSDNESPFSLDLSTTRTAPLAVWIVDDRSSDRDEVGGDGVCKTAAGGCTLRAAIDELNRVDGSHEIRFAVSEIDASLTDRHATITKTTFVNGASFGDRVTLLTRYGGIAFSSGVPEGSAIRGLSINSFSGWNGHTVEDTYVGLDKTGNFVRESPGAINVFGSNNRIGWPLTLELGNLALRVQLNGENNTIQGTWVGTNGSRAFISEGNGIDAGAASNINTTIGGLEPGAGNLVSGHQNTIRIQEGVGLKVGGDGIVVQGNMFGTNAQGLRQLLEFYNANDGIQSFADVLIGGTVENARNIISGSLGFGVRLSGDPSTAPIVQNNYIGVNAEGNARIDNFLGGISISEVNATIGGPNGPNVISGNFAEGIQVWIDTDSGPDFIHNNLIGVDESGTEPIPNRGYGIEVISDTGVEIGGSLESGNVIAYNEKGGVNMPRRGVSVRANAIFGNGGLGLTQRNSAIPTANDTNDADDRQNYPVLTDLGDGNIQIDLNSRPSQTFAIDLYANDGCDGSGHGEGQRYLQSTELTTDASGNATAVVTIPLIAPQTALAATATAADNSTSEFSECIVLSDVQVFRVRVLQDEANPRPVANQPFLFGRAESVDADGDGNYELIGRVVSDDEGIVNLDATFYNPGDPFYLRATKSRKATAKPNHHVVGNTLYTLYVDNFKLNDEGTRMEPARLAPSIEQTTDTYLERTSLGFNLLVSVQWNPVEAYANGLIESFRSLTNLLIDVTNGHAFIDSVAFFSGSEAWEDADVRFYADNYQWPRASPNGAEVGRGYLHMPPMHYGNVQTNVVRSVIDHPLNLNQYDHFATVVHELGHYLFEIYDEYLDADGSELNDAVNYGVMDSQYRGDRPSSTEMSRTVTAAYQNTQQYARHQASSWGHFAEKYREVDGVFDAEILVPASDKPGPNESLDAPDFNFGAIMSVIDRMERRPSENIQLQVFAGGAPANAAFVLLERQTDNREIMQGRTLDHPDPDISGTIILRGADPGDRLLVSRSGETLPSGQREPFDWFYADAVVPASGKQNFSIELQKVAGELPMLPEIEFAGVDELTLNLSAPALSSAPGVEVFDAAGNSLSTTVTPVGGEYLVEVLGATAARTPFAVRLTAEDEASVRFFVPATIEVATVDTAISFVQGTVQPFDLELSPADTPVDRVAYFAFDYPTLRTGLPDSVARVTPTITIAGYPPETPFAGDLTLYWSYGNVLASLEEAVNIYSWNDTWQILDTRSAIDTSRQSVTAAIDGPGVYAAFLDLTKTTMVGAEGADTQVPNGIGLSYYPSPFADRATLVMRTGRDGTAIIEVFDLLGRKIERITNRRYRAGTHLIPFDGRRLSAGVYFVRLTANGTDTVIPLVKSR